MVTITDGVHDLTVTKGAFDSIFSKQGYRLAKKTQAVQHDTVIDNNSKKLNALVEKPISAWTKNDMKFYVTQTGLDTTAAANVEEAREIIREHIAGVAK